MLVISDIFKGFLRVLSCFLEEFKNFVINVLILIYDILVVIESGRRMDVSFG